MEASDVPPLCELDAKGLISFIFYMVRARLPTSRPKHKWAPLTFHVRISRLCAGRALPKLWLDR